MIIDAGQVDGYCEVNGLRLHYIEWGRASKPAVVLLHGLTSHAHSWDYLAVALQEDHHVVALDQRGHGDSAWPRPAAYATQDFVSDLASVLDLLELRAVALIGLSMGAHNALAFTAAHAARVKRLVAIDIPPALRRPGSGDTTTRPAVLREFSSVDDAFALARQQNPRPPEDVHRNRVAWGLRKRADGTFELKYDPDAPLYWRPDDLWDALGRITCPSLVVRGADSRVLAEQTAKDMASALAQGSLVTVKGSGHSVPLDRPLELEAVVKEFLKTAGEV